MIEIRDGVNVLLEEIRYCRRELHRYPELELETIKTKHFLISKLNEYGGFEIEEGFAKNGFVAYLRVNKHTHSIGFRSDMDALSIQEENDIDFKSKINGCSHACGHDGHMAILLGLAKYLSMHREQLKENITLVFQPGEESPGGAKLMIEEGLFRKYPMRCIFGTHLMSDVAAGTIACKAGVLMARNGEVEINVYGLGAHGASPQLGNDAIVATSSLINQFQSIISRNIDPLKSNVLTIGKINGGQARNVICDQVNMGGTIRSFSDENYDLMKQRMNEICKGIELSYQVKVELLIVDYYQVVDNDQQLDAMLKAVLLDDYSSQEPKMAAEDFSFYQKEVPGLFFYTGIKDNEFQNGIHHSQFNFNESSLLYAIETQLRLLEKMEVL